MIIKEGKKLSGEHKCDMELVGMYSVYPDTDRCVFKCKLCGKEEIKDYAK